MRITLLCKTFVAGAFCIAVFSCHQVQTDTKFEFYYFPARNVYYDVANARFIYSLNGGKIWDTLYKKMETEPPTLGKKQIIYSNVSDPWDSNEVHRNRYGGYLLDIPDVDSTTSEKILVTERKTPNRSTTAAASPVTKSDNKTEKKPGFFKRLFGKKH